MQGGSEPERYGSGEIRAAFGAAGDVGRMEIHLRAWRARLRLGGRRIMAFEAINPATGETIRHYDAMDTEQVNAAIEAAHRAFLEWRETNFAERARHMHKAAALLRERARDYGELMALEMGKPIRDGIAEAQKCATGCDYYAEHAERYLADEVVETGPRKSLVAFRPIGVVLAVMPWNFPFWQVVRFAAP